MNPYCNVVVNEHPCKRFENVFYPIKISIEEGEERQVLHCLLYSFHMEVGSFEFEQHQGGKKKMAGGCNKLKTKYNRIVNRGKNIFK